MRIPRLATRPGGISTLEDKALGCTQKSGFAPVRDVLAYGQRVKTAGLNLLSAPGNDLVASTALAAAGGTADAEPAAQTVSEEELARSEENTTKVRKIWAVAALIGVACFGGALGMAHSVAKAANNMAEQPEAAGQIRTSMMMGLVFIETVIIYALIVAILIIFVL